MSKRISHANLFSAKRQRVDNETDFWDDDDLDSDLIDDCFARATQIHETEKTLAQVNESVLPSYSFFKESNQFSSTQVTELNVDELRQKVRELQERNAEKEGEAAILRSNLQNLRASCQVEQEKYKNELNEKLNLAQKEYKMVKSELELKNLEIANLRQQIGDIARRFTKEASSPQKVESKEVVESGRCDDTKQTKNWRICITSKKRYPLRSIDISFLLDHERCNVAGVLKKQSDVEFPRCEIYYLINLSEGDLDSDMATDALDKILETLLQLLRNFKIQLGSATEDFNVVQSSKSEAKMGVAAAQVLMFLAEVILFSSYLQNSFMAKNDGLQCLSLISDIISAVGKTEKEQICQTFLLSSIAFVSKALRCEILSDVSILHELGHKLLRMKSDEKIAIELTALAHITSQKMEFVNTLCSEAGGSETCTFRLFSITLQNGLFESGSEKHFNQITLNVLSFIHNIFKSNSRWLYYTENKKYECLCLLYVLSMTIIYKNLKRYKAARPSEASIFSIIFKNSVKILSILHFNSVDLIHKYMRTYAQFKDIVYTLLQLGDSIGLDQDDRKTLETLNEAEDLPEISLDKFKDIAL